MPDSLFGSDDEEDDSSQPEDHPPAQAALDDVLIASSGSCPPIPGLYILRRAVPRTVLDDLAEALSSTVWPGSTDQVMLFTSPETPSLPPYLEPFVALLPQLLEPLPDSVKHAVLHARMPVQAILNCYHPGQGISAHVDLPERYADGIVGLSLLSSTVMEFRKAKADPPGTRTTATTAYAVRLRPGDVYVLTGEARWDWTHEIPYRDEDLVEDENGRTMRVRRGLRFSVTLRRMKDGGDVLR